VRERRFKVRKRLFKANSRQPRARKMLHCKAARIQGQECLVPQSDQLVCTHAMEEEAPVGEEGYCCEYCWENTKE